MAERKELLERIEELHTRLDSLERRLAGFAEGSPTRRAGQPLAYCAVPEVPEREFGPEVSVERASLIRVMAKKWVNETVLHYYFFDGSPWGTTEAEQEVVRRAFQRWKDIGIGLEFKEVTSRDEAEIRIGFGRGEGAWSYVGRDVLNQGQNERTMNFGWDLTRDPQEIDTAVHEIGHTLGFPHEHQNPNAGIVWNEEAVYRALAEPPNNWSREQTWWNIIRKIPPDTVEGSKWDPNSIMHYPFGPGLIQQPEQYRTGLRPNPGLSEKDRTQVRVFYPPAERVYPELRPYEAQRLSLAAGQQRNFSVLPTATKTWQMNTFGDSDTVMVLFEERDGEMQYVAGDDDSGWDRNAQIRVRLMKGRRYVLRIRLYYNFSSGDTLVLLW